MVYSKQSLVGEGLAGVGFEVALEGEGGGA
jgi:hypothetical protein